MTENEHDITMTTQRLLYVIEKGELTIDAIKQINDVLDDCEMDSLDIYEGRAPEDANE